jgi:hypothetical protein
LAEIKSHLSIDIPEITFTDADALLTFENVQTTGDLRRILKKQAILWRV